MLFPHNVRRADLLRLIFRQASKGCPMIKNAFLNDAPNRRVREEHPPSLAPPAQPCRPRRQASSGLKWRTLSPHPAALSRAHCAEPLLDMCCVYPTLMRGGLLDARQLLQGLANDGEGLAQFGLGYDQRGSESDDVAMGRLGLFPGG